MSLAACREEDTPEAVASQDTPPPAAPSAAGPVNNAPVLQGDAPLLGRAGDAYSFSPAASDADNDALTFTVTGLPEWASFNAANGTISGTPNDGHVGQTGDIEITVSDGTATDSIGPFRILIGARQTPGSPQPPSNNAPVISGTPASLVVATQSYIFVPTATDADGDRLTFAIANRPTWATFSTSTGQLSGTPSRTQAGTVSNIRISVTDGRTVVALAPFSIQVQPLPNSAPVLSGAPATTATVGVAYSFTPSATDADGNTLRWSIENPPSWATFNNTTGRLSGTPTSAGVFSSIRISANDGTVTVPLPTFGIVVSAAPNRVPSITGSPATTGAVGTPYSFTPSASDPDAGTTLTFSIDNRPQWAAFDTTTGRLSGTPSAGDGGTSTSGIVITVSDGRGGTATLGPFSISVPAPATGFADLHWAAPDTNVDGSELTDLAGFRVYYGTSPTNLDRVVTIADEAATAYRITGLTSGNWHFTIRAYSADGTESTNSNIATKTIP